MAFRPGRLLSPLCQVSVPFPIKDYPLTRAVGAGALIACVIFLWYERHYRLAVKAGKEWTQVEEYRRLPLACFGAPCFALSLFWMGWSAFSWVHWIVPMLAGLLFGVGWLLIFMAMLNYLTDAYETFAASALAAAAFSRSIFGVVLPFATTPMYRSLGVHWAGTLLGCICLVLGFLPFVFIRYGVRLRQKSKFCQELKAFKEGCKSSSAT